ncbi:MAG: hypothetical protein JW395_3107 [Nitrospira sp.]|nr:hypothetical protein [Nitrospira sp.]
MLIGPRHDERTYVVEVRGLKDHADDLARGGGEGRMVTHDISHLAHALLKFMGRKGAIRRAQQAVRIGLLGICADLLVPSAAAGDVRPTFTVHGFACEHLKGGWHIHHAGNHPPLRRLEDAHLGRPSRQAGGEDGEREGFGRQRRAQETVGGVQESPSVHFKEVHPARKPSRRNQRLTRLGRGAYQSHRSVQIAHA